MYAGYSSNHANSASVGPQLQEVEVCSVTMATEQEEAHIYQAIAHSSSLHSLVGGQWEENASGQTHDTKMSLASEKRIA